MSAADPLLGYHLADRFTIESFMSEEQLGRLYSAIEDRTGRQVCVKVLHPHLYDNHEVSGRFEREMVATAAIEHPNTVEMIDFGDHRVFRYMVLEFLYATSLFDVLRNSQGISVERTVHIAAQIARALSAAHQQNIVHRNLNSGNILLLLNAKGDYVKVRDFGLSWLEDQGGEDGNLTAFDNRVGDTTYMAPEYIQDATVSPQGDLYALGVLTYEMLTGKPPFLGTGTQVAALHCTQAPPPLPSELDVPEWLDALLMSLLEKSPDSRPGSAQEVVFALEAGAIRPLTPPEIMSYEEAASWRQAQAAPEAEPEAPPTTSKLPLIVVALLALTVVLAVAALAMLGIISFAL